MAIFRMGNMWDEFYDCDLFLITTNSCLTGNGRLVMGAGIAKEALIRYPGIDRRLGHAIAQRNAHLGEYYLLPSPQWVDKRLGCFQVKRHWRDKADINLIKESTKRLLKFIKTNNPKLVNLNFPGIGFGGLDRGLVLPIISVLPDCVHVWELKNE